MSIQRIKLTVHQTQMTFHYLLDPKDSKSFEYVFSNKEVLKTDGVMQNEFLTHTLWQAIAQRHKEPFNTIGIKDIS